MLEWFELKWISCICWKTAIINPGAPAGKNGPGLCRLKVKKFCPQHRWERGYWNSAPCLPPLKSCLKKLTWDWGGLVHRSPYTLIPYILQDVLLSLKKCQGDVVTPGVRSPWDVCLMVAWPTQKSTMGNYPFLGQTAPFPWVGCHGCGVLGGLCG